MQRAALARIVEAYPPDHATQLGGLDAAQRTGDLLELYEGAARNAQALWGVMTDAVAGAGPAVAAACGLSKDRTRCAAAVWSIKLFSGRLITKASNLGR